MVLVRFSPVLEKPPVYGMDSGVVDRGLFERQRVQRSPEAMPYPGNLWLFPDRPLLALFWAYRKVQRKWEGQGRSLPIQSACATGTCRPCPVIVSTHEKMEAPVFFSPGGGPLYFSLWMVSRSFPFPLSEDSDILPHIACSAWAGPSDRLRDCHSIFSPGGESWKQRADAHS